MENNFKGVKIGGGNLKRRSRKGPDETDMDLK